MKLQEDKYVSEALGEKHPLTIILRKKTQQNSFSMVSLSLTSQRQSPKKKQSQRGESERATVALQRNRRGYILARGLKIVQGIEKERFLFYLLCPSRVSTGFPVAFRSNVYEPAAALLCKQWHFLLGQTYIVTKLRHCASGSAVRDHMVTVLVINQSNMIQCLEI